MTSLQKFTKMDMFLTERSLSLKGEFVKLPFRSLDWFERRLLIVEIAFLTKVWNSTDIIEPKCVYINSNGASGRHIQILSDLFPKIHFFCYSPHSMDLEPKEERISVFTGQADGVFNFDEASNYAGFDDVILISNLETQSSASLLMEEYEAADLKFEDGLDKASILAQNPGEDTEIYWNLAMNNFRLKERSILAGDASRQKTWLEIIRPRFALLKFRPPTPMIPLISDGTDPMNIIGYVEGDYYWQPWSSSDFGEIRISVERPIDGGAYLEDIWNLRNFAAQRRYQNHNVRRAILFDNPYTDGVELLHDFDSAYEGYVLAAFLNKFHAPAPQDLIAKVQQLSQYITVTLGGPSLAERREFKLVKHTLKPELFEFSPVVHAEAESPGADSPNNWFDPRLSPHEK